MSVPIPLPYRIAWGCLAGALLASTLLAYMMARGAGWQFDDYINLKDLSSVSTQAGFLNFVFEGIAGPLGRPLSLVTFIANYDDWPMNPWGFIQLSLLLHFINASLVFVFAARMLALELPSAAYPKALAAAIACFWLLMPIHAPALLMPIQRMTLVSSFFMLLTLWGYLALRAQHIATPSWRGMITISLWTGLGTFLAAFSKENGVAVLTLIGLIEIFFFSRAQDSDFRNHIWRLWILGTVVAVPLALAWHVTNGWDSINGTYQYYRGHSMADQLATQSVISWEYLRQALLPQVSQIGPYHDDHPVYRWHQWQPWVSVLAWAALAAIAIRLHRSKTSLLVKQAGFWLGFAILWYWACHQVESTLLPLELYFEHRNYLALLGFCTFGVVMLGRLLHKGMSSAVGAGGGLLLIVQLIALFQITSLWGRPALANEMWHIYHPRSTRALQTLANDIVRMGFVTNAVKLADDFIDANNSADVAIQFFPQRCILTNDRKELGDKFSELLPLVQMTRKPAGLVTGLKGLGEAIRNEKCTGIELTDYKNFLEGALLTKPVEWNNRVRQHFLYELALTDMALDDFEGYVHNAQQAYFSWPTMSIARAITTQLMMNGDLDEAIAWIDTVIDTAPGHTLRIAWESELTSMKQALTNISDHLRESNETP